MEAARAALDDTRLLQRTQIELAEAAVESAQAAVTQAELSLGYTTIRSPITGIIGKIQVDRGNLVGKGEPTLLTTVSTVDPIFVDFSITDADLLHFSERIRTGARGEGRPARADLELVLADGTVFPQKGRLVFVDRAVDAKTGTIGVRAEFPNPQKVLRPGQFGRVRAVVEEVPNAVLVPQLAIQELQGNKAVLVVGAGDKAAARTVTLAIATSSFTSSRGVWRAASASSSRAPRRSSPACRWLPSCGRRRSSHRLPPRRRARERLRPPPRGRPPHRPEPGPGARGSPWRASSSAGRSSRSSSRSSSSCSGRSPSRASASSSIPSWRPPSSA